mmetsp:Transcript_1601/g.3073  ORF Transcript_1601/g.3073 Transcript_1601/m.3073 type:complete len:323 (+) Transcript_1601:144-1112(+)
MSTSASQPGGGGPSQAEVDDILGAALDALDDLDDDEEEQSADLPVGASAISTAAPAQAEEAQQQAPRKVYYGPEPPPPARSPSQPAATAAASSSPSASLEDAMSQLMKAGEALQGGEDISNIDLDGAEKMLDQLMDQLQLGGVNEVDGAADGTRSNANSKQRSNDGPGKMKGGDRNKKEKDDDGIKGIKVSSDNGNSQKPHSNAASRATTNTSAGPDAGADVDRAVKRLLSDMAKASSDDIPNMDEINGGQMEAVGEEMMESMMKELSAFGSSGDADDVVDGMMKQLLSKDLMYDPMKQVCDRFPAWLAESKAHLSEEEYQK